MRATSQATATAPAALHTIDIPMYTPESCYDDSIHLRVTFEVTRTARATRIKYVNAKVCHERDVSFALQNQIKEQCVEQLTQYLYGACAPASRDSAAGYEHELNETRLRPEGCDGYKGDYSIPLNTLRIDPSLIIALGKHLDDTYDDMQYMAYLEEQHEHEEDSYNSD